MTFEEWINAKDSGAVLRPHGSGTAVGVSPNTVQFTIARIA